MDNAKTHSTGDDNQAPGVEVIAIINRYGHGQSYIKTLVLETALCNSLLVPRL